MARALPAVAGRAGDSSVAARQRSAGGGGTGRNVDIVCLAIVVSHREPALPRCVPGPREARYQNRRLRAAVIALSPCASRDNNAPEGCQLRSSARSEQFSLRAAAFPPLRITASPDRRIIGVLFAQAPSRGGTPAPFACRRPREAMASGTAFVLSDPGAASPHPCDHVLIVPGVAPRPFGGRAGAAGRRTEVAIPTPRRRARLPHPSGEPEESHRGFFLLSHMPDITATRDVNPAPRPCATA